MNLYFILLTITINLLAVTAQEEQEYIHLPGSSCDDAPDCPDNRVSTILHAIGFAFYLLFDCSLA